jgi:hypothetical protein
MAADEDMAISFYKVGDAVDLAAQLIGLLESPKDQKRVAEQNYAAAIRMTMPNVVRHYLRWFELDRRKRALRSANNAVLRRWRSRTTFRSSLHGLPPGSIIDWPSDVATPSEDQKERGGDQARRNEDAPRLRRRT